MKFARKAFTLIELLVVIAIIAILAAILFPVFAQAREAARKATCISNLRQISTAVFMYAQDYDETPPETGWEGPCSSPIPDAKGNYPLGDQYFSGVFSFPIATAPYIKNWQIFSCPSDPDKGGFNKYYSYCYEAQLLAVHMPNSYAGMRKDVNAFLRSFPLSYAGNYFLSSAYDPTLNPSGYRGGKMYPLAYYKCPSNVFFATDVGSRVLSNGVIFAGWYIAPGYDNDAAGRGRWPKGKRHALGRNWIFCDGHVKWFKDPPFLNPDGSPKTQAQIMWEYQHMGIYTYPEAENSDYTR